MNSHSIAHFIKRYYPEYYSLHSYPADLCVPIRKVADEWGMLCNFSPTPLVVDGVTFVSVEQLFQMMKFRDREPLMELYSSRGMKIKMVAKKWERTHRRDDWGCIIVDALKFCLYQKYLQHTEFREILEKTRGCCIVEDQTSRRKKTADTWGVKLVGDHYEGSNLLGRLLMELRDNSGLEYTLPSDVMDFIAVIHDIQERTR